MYEGKIDIYGRIMSHHKRIVIKQERIMVYQGMIVIYHVGNTMYQSRIVINCGRIVAYHNRIVMYQYRIVVYQDMIVISQVGNKMYQLWLWCTVVGLWCIMPRLSCTKTGVQVSSALIQATELMQFKEGSINFNIHPSLWLTIYSLCIGSVPWWLINVWFWSHVFTRLSFSSEFCVYFFCVKRHNNTSVKMRTFLFCICQ